MKKSTFAFVSLICWWVAGATSGLDYVTLQRDGTETQLAGQVVTEAVDGGLLLRDRESVLWAIPAEQLVRHWEDDAPYKPMSRAELSSRLVEELPGFRLHHTANYLIAYNTSLGYAQWCGALYERLYRAFRNYWERRGFDLRDPDTPLVALVFDTPETYRNYAQAELGDAAKNIDGYYSLQTNRVTMYDLTGTQGMPQGFARATTSAQINRLLMQPGAERMVATIIHEATHQLAYNCGFHARFADIPLWVSEGLAVYFETPDLRSSQGWRNIGGINPYRLEQFGRYVKDRPADSLQTLISGDDRFRQPEKALDAYAEAWALNYFLIRKYTAQYIRYLQAMAQKSPLISDTPEERLAVFQKVFGEDIRALDEQFLDYMDAAR